MKIFFNDTICDLYEFIDEIEEICECSLEDKNTDFKNSIEAIAEIISNIKEILGE